MTEEYLQQKIDVLLKHIDRIKHIIEHIRTFSREQVSTSIERVDVNEVCRNAISMLQTQYQNHNVIITSNLDETIGYVVGNTYKLEQVVLNLITNAKDAVDGKEQMIRNGSYQKRITLSTSCDVDRIYVDIEDNGVGISEEQIQNIFDPFFTTKDPEHGTGLGLSVSYGIIKEIQGDISVQSQLGEYTLMRISLPRVK
jgi:signal transduction histidine kinase